MTPITILLLITLVVLILGAIFTRVEPRIVLVVAAAMVAIVFVMTMVR